MTWVDTSAVRIAYPEGGTPRYGAPPGRVNRIGNPVDRTENRVNRTDIRVNRADKGRS